ncbi:MAG: F0F1 ATP synthase subunit A [Clostridiales bacterium]|nr:F0F1 ATP synthase subunit A [Clostridiales bacterium]
MNVNVEGAFVYFTIPILGGIPISQTTVSMLLVTLLLVTAAVKLGKNLQKRPGKVQVMVEKVITMLYTMVGDSMGQHNLHWAPFIGTIFACSICGTFIGLTGFFRSVTADLSCTMVWSVMVSVIIWYINIKRNGLKNWLKGFTEPIAVMTPMNIISEIAQPASMAFRHFGNVAGGGVITSIIYTAFTMVSALILNAISASGVLVGIVLMAAGAALLVWWKTKKRKLIVLIGGLVSAALGLFGILEAAGILAGVPVLALGVPAVLSCYFDLFSGFVQAYVFTLLTMTYIAGACPPPEEANA